MSDLRAENRRDFRETLTFVAEFAKIQSELNNKLVRRSSSAAQSRFNLRSGRSLLWFHRREYQSLLQFRHFQFLPFLAQVPWP